MDATRNGAFDLLETPLARDRVLESGAGKELLAAHVRRESLVASGPFVKIN